MANSYKDSKWSNLSSITEKRLGLPEGLLKNIVLHGEKSNADQVSSAGAKTVFQIIPETRNAILKKYKVDAYESDKNSALAAGYLLKEALDRNNGNVEAAIGEYHGGTDRTNWGPVNKAYRQRVLSAMGGRNFQDQPANSARDQYQNQSKSIVDEYRKQQAERQKANQPKPNADADRSKKIIAAYQKAREDGKIQDSTTQPQGLPDFDANGNFVPEQPVQPQQPKPEASLGQKISGGLEAAATVGSGLIGAPIGQTLGTIKGAAQAVIDGNFGTPQGAQNILNTANTAAHALTYEPRTAAGQENVQGIGEFIQDVGLDTLPPVMGGIGVAASTLGGASIPVVSGAARDLAQATSQAVQRPIQATTNAIRSGVDGLKDAVGLNRDTGTNPAPANVGAAQVDQATIRDALAQDLPYPPQLTQGQLTRDPGQLKFETETAKNSNLGTPLRQRYEEQHEVMQQNLEAFIDDTGAQATNMREVGLSVDSALQKQMKADKNRVRVAYAKADKSNEAQLPVDLTQPVRNGNDSLTVLDYLNSQPDLKSTPIISDAKSIATKLGIANKDSNGDLIPASPTVQQMEKWRSEINQNTNLEPTNVRQTAILKSLIDQHVEPVAGPLYRAARVERKRMADHWENRAIIKDLTTNKTGSSDRKVALEDVQKRIIHDGSLDDMRFAKRALLTSGEEGKQAWRDIQGQTLQEIKLEATKGVAPDARGNQMISPAALNTAINKLDKSGKLDFIFGKQGAEKLRAVNEISKTLFTVPASAAINHSNTAATLTAAMDIALSGMSGFPAPVASALRLATKHIKDNKVRARVQKALNPQRTT
ncbi:hypothetical protein AS4_28600 [Acinetobacter guillouiae]|uniref:transglycosylase SLT domain-containing protein n=1 Tax=Acinetobacter guillouiae TaxID=106649 RepID=UPI0004EF5E8E|nr:transglycosylase SLT domain-containing protein [Acinetobacter guillouiae]BAP37800.1 hypothetical protein AS4_28600 [Acinetobacter guillouiae]